MCSQGRLGCWSFQSKRQRPRPSTPSGTLENGSQSPTMTSAGSDCRAFMFSMVVTEELDVWPEQHRRKRYWVSVHPPCHNCVFLCVFLLSAIWTVTAMLLDYAIPINETDHAVNLCLLSHVLLQLSIPEASSRCRYDWMKGALTEWAETVVRPSPLRILNASNHEEVNDRTSPPASKPALV